MTDDTSGPPPLARWLLRRVLTGPARSAIVGDLDEEFSRFVAPRLGARAARRWYWRQAMMSLAACLRGPSVSSLDSPGDAPLRSALLQDREGLAGDIRAALQICLRRPLLSAVAILTLALGIGANTAVFSVINALFLKKLPIAHADRLVVIDTKDGGSFTFPEYVAARGAAGLDAVVAGGRLVTIFEDRGARQWLTVDIVSGNFFDALGVRAGPRGRLFREEDDAAKQPPVVVLSDRFWQQRFRGDPAAIGQTVRLGRSLSTIVGVAPPGFVGADVGFGPDAWIPITQGALVQGDARMLDAQTSWLGLLGILHTGKSLETARAGLEAQWKQHGTSADVVLRLIPRGRGFDWFSPQHGSYLKVVSGFVALILLICCLNVATLLGAGVHGRHKELAIRAALGAGRLRLLRQLVAEHLLLAIAGGLVGGVVGLWLARVLVALMSCGDIPGDLDVRLVIRVLLFTAVVSIASALGFGLVPALRWSRVNGLAALQGSNGAGIKRLFRSGGLWWFVPWQVALGTVLLASAGVLMKTVHQLKLGIESASPERVWFANLEFDIVNPAPSIFDDLPDRLVTHLQLLPGVEAAAVSTLRPLSTSSRTAIDVEGVADPPASRPMPWGPPPPPPPRGAPQELEKHWIVSNSFVSSGFLRTLGLPVLEGRDFDARDRAHAPQVAIVNETFARRAFGTASALGRRLSIAGAQRFEIEVVGVVRDLRYEHLREAAPDGVFFPLSQMPKDEAFSRTATGEMHPRDLTLMLRTRVGRRLTAEQLRSEIAAVDARLFVDRVWTFDEEAGRALSQERLLAWLGTGFGVLALLILIVGLYGTLATAVIRGRRELGIRLALGASPLSLRAMVVGRSLMVVGVGLAGGLPLSYAATKSFANLLYGVRPGEPLLGTGIAVVLLCTAGIAAYLPARRAARVDPVIALRVE